MRRRTYGEVLSRITNDVDTLGQSLNQSVNPDHYIRGNNHRCTDHDDQYFSPLMTRDRTCDPAGIYGTDFCNRENTHRNISIAQQEYLGHINGQVEEVYGGHLVVKAL